MLPLEEGIVSRYRSRCASRGTDGVAEEHREKVDHFVVAEATTGKAHLLTDGREHAQTTQIVRDHRHFLEHVIMPLSLIVWLVEAIREAVLHLLLSNIPSRACLWPGALRRACLFSAR